jgi:hypothetical protein
MGVKRLALITMLAGVTLFGSPLLGQTPPTSDSAKTDEPRCLTRSELIALKESRSVVAEAALAAELFAGGGTTNTFAATLMKEGSEQLEGAKASLEDREQLTRLLDSALGKLASRDAAGLRDISMKLFSIEWSNGQCS